MTYSYFKEVTARLFSPLKEKYFLALSSGGDGILEYHHKDFVLLISMDHYFEISITFIQYNKRIGIADFLAYLDYPVEEIETVQKNQRNEKNMDTYLQNVRPLVDAVICQILEKPSLFEDCYLYVSENREHLLQKHLWQQTKKQLNERWRACDYAGFCALYEKAKGLVAEDKLLQKKAIYAKSQLDSPKKSGDGRSIIKFTASGNLKR